MDYDQANWEITEFSLPKAFWIALSEVRTYLIRNSEFVDRIYGMDRDPSLRQAFDLMDECLKKMLDDHSLLESC